MPRAVVIIPARYAATRFPGKPLARETGKCLIQHVCEQAALAACVDGVVVATDDERIRAAVAAFGGKAIMTSPHHRSGTDRVAEAARQIEADVIVNVRAMNRRSSPRPSSSPSASSSSTRAPTCPPSLRPSTAPRACATPTW